MHASRGFIEIIYGWNPAAASRAFAEALRLGPERAIIHHRLGLFLLSQRRFEEAESALRHAAALDPLSPIFATACALPLTARGVPQDAQKIYRTVIESEPSFYPVRFYLGLALEAAGQHEEAIAEFRAALQISDTETEALPALAHTLARTGQTLEATAIAERLRAAAAQRFISPFFFAVVALGLGDYAEALRFLEEAVEQRAMRLHDLHLDPRFTPLRGEPRFQRVLTTIGTDPEAQGAG